MSSEARAPFLPERPLQASRISPLLASALVAAPLLLAAPPVRAQQTGYGQTLGTSPMERQVYDGGTSKPGSGSLLNSTNPLDLLNQMRKGTALQDATPPSSAIDDALNQLEAQSKPKPSTAATAQSATDKVGTAATAPPVASTPVGTAPSGPASAPLTQPVSSPQRPSL